jgi:hypothetical protein
MDKAKRARTARGAYATLSDGSRLLVGQDIADLDGFVEKIDAALALAIALILVLAAAASVAVTRRTVGRIEAMRRAVPSCEAVSASGSRCAVRETSG